MIEGSTSTPRAEAAYRVEPEPSGIDFEKILGAFRRHVWFILVTTAVTLGVAAYMVSKEVDQFTAMAVIRLIDRNQPVGVETAGDVPLGDADPLLSEMMVLKGRTVLGQAVDREGFRLFNTETWLPANFTEDVEITFPPDRFGTIRLEFEKDGVSYGPDEDRRRAAYGEPIILDGVRFVVSAPPAMKAVTLRVVRRDVAIDYLQAGLQTAVQEGTGGVDVSFTSTDPFVPPRVVNAAVQVYQEVNAELARQNVRRRRAFLEEQLRTTDSLLMTAQAGLSGFRAREQSYSAAGRFTAEQGNLIQVEIQQAQMQGDLRLQENTLNRVLQGRATGQSSDMSSLMASGIGSSPVVSQLYSQLVGYRTERESMLAGPWARAPTHPDVQRLDTLIAATEEKLLEAARDHVASLRAQIASLGSLRGRALAQMSNLPRTEVEEVYLTQNLAALQQMGDQLRDQYQAVRLEEAAQAGLVEIVQLATWSLPIPSSPWNKLLLGLLAGLMLGGGLALLREKLDHSINRPEEIEGILLLPNLAVIPQATTYLLESGANGGGRRSPLDPPGAEAYRVLRTNLLYSQGELKTLVVTSAAPGEGKTMTAVNLAASIARQGRRVLLMECDLRRPSLKRYFEEREGLDLSDILLEDRAWREAVRPSGIPGLDLLLASRSVPRAAEFLAGAGMKELLDQLASQYDMVILDTSPLLVAADATVLGAIVDGVLLVVRTTHTDRGAVQQAVHQLSLVGANIVGTVLNDPEGAVARYGTYYDYSAAYEGE
jgi:capsular exopolysaccharide synthesis family protein